MAATDSVLGRLHEKLAQAYLNELDGEELSPALLTSIAKFLKDNGIQSEIGDEDMDKLAEKAGDVLKFPFSVAEANGP